MIITRRIGRCFLSYMPHIDETEMERKEEEKKIESLNHTRTRHLRTDLFCLPEILIKITEKINEDDF